MPERSLDWLKQAEHDLEKAKLDLQWQYHEWACFTAHQAAEKAVKAVYYAHHGEARGHGVRELLSYLKLATSEGLLENAIFLDRFYIPTRYPNGLPAGVPHDYFSQNDALKAIEALRERAANLVDADPMVLEVSLFGSLVKGNYGPGSDADLLVILKADLRRFVDRLSEFLPYFIGVGIHVDVFPYTVEEIE